tara:strand:+ start:290 stop:592 length:303 start_codon:yes stop_codon:yes gene_type:complete
MADTETPTNIVYNLKLEIEKLKKSHENQMRWKNRYKRDYLIEKQSNIKLRQQRRKLIGLLKIDEHLMSSLARDSREREQQLKDLIAKHNSKPNYSYYVDE